MILHLGDCRTVLASLPTDSFDSVVTDPPYELGFMGKAWDKSGVAFDPETWRAVLRVAKPGAMLLAFGGTRTFHRLTCAIEDAGFEIRDCLMWLYGQGFPKSHNGAWGGTALKPGWEPIVMARKPLVGTVAANFEEHGTGGLDVDGCRIFTDWSERSEAWKASGHSAKPDAEKIAAPPGQGINCHPAGRWPANVLLEHADGCECVGTKRVKGTNVPGMDRGSALGRMNDDGWQAKERKPTSFVDADGTEEVADWRCVDGCPVRVLDEQSGELSTHRGSIKPGHAALGYGGGNGSAREVRTDRGGASRFFYCGKATRKERGEGNDHPTVKPVELLRYLVRLVTPGGGTVLDPFMGSGSTGLAAIAEGRGFVGVELLEKHIEIARRRIEQAAPLLARSA